VIMCKTPIRILQTCAWRRQVRSQELPRRQELCVCVVCCAPRLNADAQPRCTPLDPRPRLRNYSHSHNSHYKPRSHQHKLRHADGRC